MKTKKTFTEEQEILFEKIYESRNMGCSRYENYYNWTFKFKNTETKNFIKLRFLRESFNKSFKTKKYFYWIDLNIFKKRKRFNSTLDYENQFGSGNIKDLIMVKNFLIWCVQYKKYNFLITGSDNRRNKIYFRFLKKYIDRSFVENGNKVLVLESF